MREENRTKNVDENKDTMNFIKINVVYLNQLYIFFILFCYDASEQKFL